MKYFQPLMLLLFSLQLMGQSSAHYGAAKYLPEDNKKFLIIGQDLGAVGGLDDYDDGYVDHLDHVPAGVTTYTGFPGLSGLRNKANWGSGDVHADAYLSDTTFDNTFFVIGLHLVDQLNRIVAGNFDAEITSLGNWIKDQKRPVFLRIGYEFDGSWNGYDPETYQSAWRYIVHEFDKMDIRNIAYVWQSAGINSATVDRWYPGDEYVNWVAYSHFDGTNPGQSIRDFAESHDKPIMIAESTPRRDLKIGPGQFYWDEWYDPLFATIYGNDRIRALAYINVDWDSQSMWEGQGWGDSRVQVNPTVMFNWETEIEQDTWVVAHDGLFDDLGYQVWQDSTILNVSSPVVEMEMVLTLSENHLQIHLDNSPGPKSVAAIDLNGKLMYSNQTGSRIIEIDRSDLPGNQIIIIKVTTESGSSIRKIWIN